MAKTCARNLQVRLREYKVWRELWVVFGIPYKGVKPYKIEQFMNAGATFVSLLT
jgi:hypothetical protein